MTAAAALLVAASPPPVPGAATDSPGGLPAAEPAAAAELAPETLAAFRQYAGLVEARFREQVGPEGPYLHVDHLPAAESREVREELRRGELYMDDLELRRPDGEEVEVPDGMIHHWIGAVFAPGASLEATLDLVQAYDRHAEIYSPDVDEARVIERDGDEFTVFMRFRKKKVITVIVDTIHDVVYQRPAPGRAWSISRTTEVREVENAGEPDERRLPDGQGQGFLWRLGSYWRFLERDGGVWIECESVSLTRDIPFLLRWLIGPFVNDVPRESLESLLDKTRLELAEGGPEAARPAASSMGSAVGARAGRPAPSAAGSRTAPSVAGAGGNPEWRRTARGPR